MSKRAPLPTTQLQFINELNAIAYSAGLHVQRVFTDWLQMIVCALSMGSMEELYMKTMKHYTEKGKDLPNRIARLFSALVEAMEGRKDVLGDVFMECVSRGNNGQFFTPMEICRMMAQMTAIPDKGTPSVCDPACGSGRTLLAVAEINPRSVLVGQDNDLTCVQMLAVNLSLNGLTGYAVHGNSLTNEIWAVYKIGMPGIPGVIYRVSYQFMCRQLEWNRETKESEVVDEAIPDQMQANQKRKTKAVSQEEFAAVGRDYQSVDEEETSPPSVIYVQKNLFNLE